MIKYIFFSFVRNSGPGSKPDEVAASFADKAAFESQRAKMMMFAAVKERAIAQSESKDREKRIKYLEDTVATLTEDKKARSVGHKILRSSQCSINTWYYNPSYDKM